jgi:hypothetical protein
MDSSLCIRLQRYLPKKKPIPIPPRASLKKQTFKRDGMIPRKNPKERKSLLLFVFSMARAFVRVAITAEVAEGKEWKWGFQFKSRKAISLW